MTSHRCLPMSRRGRKVIPVFRRRRPMGALLVFAVVSLAACGGSPTATDSPAAEGEAANGSTIDSVYEAVDGLEGEERFQALLELAQQEDGTLTHYTTMNLDNSEPLMEAFTDATGIEVELYRAVGSTIVERLRQEAQAGHAGADVVSMNSVEMAIVDKEGLLLPLESPVLQNNIAVTDTYAADFLNVHISAWNTQRVDPAEAPSSWPDLLSDPPGKSSLEPGDWAWFATVVEGVLMEREGMTKEEALELFADAVERGVFTVDGHTSQSNLLAAGQFDVAASVYLHYTLQQIDDGAPVAWNEPQAVEPLIVVPDGIGMHRDTDQPASALLLVEWVLSKEGQEVMWSFPRHPGRTDVEGSIPAEYETLTVDGQRMLAEQEEWMSLYDKVLRGAPSLSE